VFHRGDPHPQDSAAAISQLKSGGIRPVMITGDTARTAVHIAREVGMLHNASSTGVCVLMAMALRRVHCQWGAALESVLKTFAAL
jgi:magnesium-transporting ATPase (P-type)